MKARVNKMLDISPTPQLANNINKKESSDPTERLRASFGVPASDDNEDDNQVSSIVGGIEKEKAKRKKNKPTPKKPRK